MITSFVFRKSAAKFSLDRSMMIMNIRLEPKDVARMNTFDNNRCRKCLSTFKEGDIVEKIGARPSKYYHRECFRPY